MVYDGKCYVVEMEAASWYEARNLCLENGGHLAEICDADLNAEILQLYQSLGLGWIWSFKCLINYDQFKDIYDLCCIY